MSYQVRDYIQYRKAKNRQTTVAGGGGYTGHEADLVRARARRDFPEEYRMVDLVLASRNQDTVPDADVDASRTIKPTGVAVNSDVFEEGSCPEPVDKYSAFDNLVLW